MQTQAHAAPAGFSSLPEGELQTEIGSMEDIVTARQRARTHAIALGFSSADVTLVATAISEIARNIVEHARIGEITMRIVELEDRRGLQIVARDHGPGIADVARAFQYGCTKQRRTGVGLPGVKELMDEFEIVSDVGCGTKVTMTKWVR